MKALYLAIGILFVAIAFERSRKWGALLLVIIVLGMLMTATRKKII